ncbi:MAG: VWA domain-containing protein [Phycisphaerales bacterium]|nr:VWA domain-containing protein [Phycisphaerales bacterium]
MIPRLANPEALWLLLAIPLLIAWRMRASSVRPSGIMFSSIDLLATLPVTFRQRLRGLPVALRAAAITLAVVALARPQMGVGEVKVTADGVAIMALIDRSWSMTEQMDFDGRRSTRIDTVKRVFREFVKGNKEQGGDLPGRGNDLIGVVTFARTADTVAPLVRDHDTLVRLVDGIQLINPQIPEGRATEGGTAIGDGLALAAARLHTAEKDLRRFNKDLSDPEFIIRSKAIILLTDGEENAGELSAVKAGELAKQWGIRIYAIGIGGNEPQYVQTTMGIVMRPSMGFDDRPLRAIADMTGGLYRRADTGDALRDIYREINALEKTEIKTTEFTSYDEKFVPFALAALVCLAVEVLLSSTWLRRAP